jgi:putative membrane protein
MRGATERGPMATADAGPVSRTAKEHPRALTAVLTVVGYALVIGTLYVGLPIYPTIDLGTVNLLSDAIAVINTTTVVLLLAGWKFIRDGDVRKHRAAMVAAFTLILVFLVLYLLKTGGGGRKEFVGPDTAALVYFAMLGIHIVLSVLSVPLVLYNIIVGLTHSTPEIRETAHARVGRVAVAVWSVSLTLGVLAYVLLNHVYTFEFVRLLVRVPAPF